MFNRVRKCLDDFETKFNKGELTKEEQKDMWFFYIDFAKAALIEIPEADKVAKIILIEHNLKT